MRAPRVLFFGGNGHSTARIAPARAAAGARFELVDAHYPGFEGRERAPSFDDFLGAIAARIGEPALSYGTGIGGLILLCLRARGEHLGSPILLQAPVLWGLERRLMPKLMRAGFAQLALRRAFTSPWFQRRFARKQFTRLLTPEEHAAFFAGYASCAALPDFFAWMTPALLRRLEIDLAGRPERLERISVWWGERDRVVTPAELEITEQALGVKWPLQRFPAWGHYPMIDDPRGWADALAEVVAP
jgi:pimeloyl-ACP methyl ester carboxylesterase